MSAKTKQLKSGHELQLREGWLVNPDGVEIPSAKRARAQPEVDLKLKAIYSILHWH